MRQKFIQLGAVINIRAREMMGIGLPLMVTTLTVFVLTQADLWVIDIFGPEEQVATFGTAARLGQLVFIPLLIDNTGHCRSYSIYFLQRLYFLFGIRGLLHECKCTACVNERRSIGQRAGGIRADHTNDDWAPALGNEH